MAAKKRGLGLFKLRRSLNDIHQLEWSRNDQRLVEAVEAGELRTIESLIKKKRCNPVKLDPQGHSALHIAAMRNRYEVIQLFIARGVKVDGVDFQGRTALHCAARHQATEVIEVLNQYKESDWPLDGCKMCPLHHACIGGSLDCVRSLIMKFPQDINTVDEEGRTPLFFCAQIGHTPVCKLLLERGAEPNWQDFSGRTALSYAAEHESQSVCILLKGWKADPELQDHLGRSAIWYAMDAGNTAIKRFLSGDEEEVLQPSEQQLNRGSIIMDKDDRAVSPIIEESESVMFGDSSSSEEDDQDELADTNRTRTSSLTRRDHHKAPPSDRSYSPCSIPDMAGSGIDLSDEDGNIGDNTNTAHHSEEYHSESDSAAQTSSVQDLTTFQKNRNSGFRRKRSSGNREAKAAAAGVMSAQVPLRKCVSESDLLWGGEGGKRAVLGDVGNSSPDMLSESEMSESEDSGEDAGSVGPITSTEELSDGDYGQEITKDERNTDVDDSDDDEEDAIPVDEDGDVDDDGVMKRSDGDAIVEVGLTSENEDGTDLHQNVLQEEKVSSEISAILNSTPDCSEKRTQSKPVAMVSGQPRDWDSPEVNMAIVQLRHEAQQLREQNLDLNIRLEQMDQLQLEVEDSKSEILTFEENKKRMQVDMKKISEELKSEKEMNSQLLAKLGSVTEKDTALTQQIHRLDLHMTELESEKKDLQKKVEGLEESFTWARAKLKRARARQHAWEEEKTALVAHVETVEASKLEAEMAAEEAKKEARTFREKSGEEEQEQERTIEELMDENFRLSQSVAEWRESAEDSGYERQRLESVAQCNKEILDLKQKEVSSLERQISLLQDLGVGGGTMQMSSAKESQAVRGLQYQVANLQKQLAEADRIHQDTLRLYKEKLLLSVQGCLDEKTMETLRQIIDIRKEPF